jgi:C-terminal processing protease CtpA/Prc
LPFHFATVQVQSARGTAEAVAAAVQDHRRGTVLGGRTAGDATVEVAQTFRTVTLPVPVGYLLRASGQRLDGGGVVPDVLEGASDAAPSAIARDEACPNVASTHAVADDPLVKRAASLLR